MLQSMEIPQKFRKIAGMLTVHLNRDVSGNPGGRPIGSVSIVGMIRKKFEEQPEYAEEWVDKLLEMILQTERR